METVITSWEEGSQIIQVGTRMDNQTGLRAMERSKWLTEQLQTGWLRSRWETNILFVQHPRGRWFSELKDGNGGGGKSTLISFSAIRLFLPLYLCSLPQHLFIPPYKMTHMYFVSTSITELIRFYREFLLVSYMSVIPRYPLCPTHREGRVSERALCIL